MPVLLALAAAAGAVLFYIIRARNAASMTHELLDVAHDVRLAARRFGFRRAGNQHPAEAIEDPNIAIAGIGAAFLELDDLPAREQRLALTSSLGRTARLPLGEAEEMLILGRWMINQCGGAEQAVTRLGRKLYKMQGAEGFQPMMEVVQSVAQAGEGGLSTKQKGALEDLRRAFRMS